MIGLYMYYLHSTPIPSDMKQKLLIPYQNFTTFILSYSSLAGFVCVDKNLIKACLHNWPPIAMATVYVIFFEVYRLW